MIQSRSSVGNDSLNLHKQSLVVSEDVDSVHMTDEVNSCLFRGPGNVHGVLLFYHRIHVLPITLWFESMVR